MSKKLPPNVISDILSRLPAETLLRFKCVSKPWCSLINGPDFIKLHLQKSSKTLNNHTLVVRRCHLYSVNLASLDAAVEFDHPLKTPSSGAETLGSCDGMLLLSKSIYSDEDYIIWNFSTRKLQKLPATEIEFPEYFTAAQYILYGFGYDSVNDDYKVVRIIQFYGDDDDSVDSEVKVYSLRANSWTRIRDCPYYMKYKRAWGVHVNGCLHWVVSRKPVSDTESFVVAFNLGTEEYVEVSLPNFADKDFHMNVGVLGGCLSLQCNFYHVSFDLWVMKVYGVKDSWVKLFSISVAQFGHFDYFAPLAYSESGGEVLLIKDDKKLVWYDIKNGSVKNVNIRGLPDSFHFEGVVFVGSLVPLNCDGRIYVEEQAAAAAQKKKRRKRNKRKRNDILSDGVKLVSGYPAEGFDVHETSKLEGCGGITELQIGDHNKEKLKTMAEIGIVNFNAQSKEEGTSAFESLKIIKASVQSVVGSFNYITFDATDATQGTHTFEAKVFSDLNGRLELEFCRIKPNTPT